MDEPTWTCEFYSEERERTCYHGQQNYFIIRSKPLNKPSVHQSRCIMCKQIFDTSLLKGSDNSYRTKSLIRKLCQLILQNHLPLSAKQIHFHNVICIQCSDQISKLNQVQPTHIAPNGVRLCVDCGNTFDCNRPNIYKYNNQYNVQIVKSTWKSKQGSLIDNRCNACYHKKEFGYLQTAIYENTPLSDFACSIIREYAIGYAFKCNNITGCNNRIHVDSMIVFEPGRPACNDPYQHDTYTRDVHYYFVRDRLFIKEYKQQLTLANGRYLRIFCDKCAKYSNYSARAFDALCAQCGKQSKSQHWCKELKKCRVCNKNICGECQRNGLHQEWQCRRRNLKYFDEFRVYNAGNSEQSIRRRASKRNFRKFGRRSDESCLSYSSHYRYGRRCDNDCDICHSMYINDEIAVETNVYNLKRAKVEKRERRILHKEKNSKRKRDKKGIAKRNKRSVRKRDCLLMIKNM